MSVIFAECTADEALASRGKLSIPYESVSAKTGKVVRRSHKVLLNAVYTHDEVVGIQEFLDTVSTLPSVATVTVMYGVTIPEFVSDSLNGKLFVKCSIDEFNDAIKTVPEHCTVLVDLQGVKPNLRKLVKVSTKYGSRVSFTGSPMLRVPSLNIGYFPEAEGNPFIRGLAKLPVVSSGEEFVTYSELSGIEEKVPAVRVPKKRTTTMIDLTTADSGKSSKPRSGAPSRNTARRDAVKSLLTPKNSF